MFIAKFRKLGGGIRELVAAFFFFYCKHHYQFGVLVFCCFLKFILVVGYRKNCSRSMRDGVPTENIVCAWHVQRKSAKIVVVDLATRKRSHDARPVRRRKNRPKIIVNIILNSAVYNKCRSNTLLL